MTSVRCIIVDDEIHCRHELRYLLSQQPDTVVVADCATIPQARQLIPALRPDLLFLDIQLGLQNGFELLHLLPSQPLTVFVTAFDNYAPQAFTVDALDYLLKPVQSERLATTLTRARHRLSTTSHQPVTSPAPTTRPTELLIPLALSGNATAIHDILMVEAQNHNSRVTLSSGIACCVRRTMREWLQLLPSTTFMHVDRSMLVNLDHIISVECNSRGGKLILGTQRLSVNIGRTGSFRLRQLLLSRNRTPR
jgi:two-component system, LytTR family, response regulator